MVDGAGSRPAGRFRQRLFEQIVADAADDTALLGKRNEIGRADVGAAAVGPARERLDGFYPAGLERNDRLVVKRDGVFGQGAAKLSLDSLAEFIGVSERRFERDDTPLAIFLASVKRQIGETLEVHDRRAMVRADG